MPKTIDDYMWVDTPHIQPKEIVKMKKRIFSLLSIPLVLSLLLVFSVFAKGSESETRKQGKVVPSENFFDSIKRHGVPGDPPSFQATYKAQFNEAPDIWADSTRRCVFGRKIIFTRNGIYLKFGKLGIRNHLCLYRVA